MEIPQKLLHCGSRRAMPKWSLGTGSFLSLCRTRIEYSVQKSRIYPNKVFIGVSLQRPPFSTMRRRMKNVFLQRSLKVLNCLMGATGVAIIMYSIWMVMVWRKDEEGSSALLSETPWFIYVLMSLGVILCLITCVGHLAADSANVCCLSFNIVIMFLLMLLEVTIAMDVVLNSDWKEDFPDDPTGKLDDLEDFVESNSETCKWIGLLMIITQVSIILLSMVLKTRRTEMRTNRIGDEEECASSMEKYPLIDPLPPMPYFIANSMPVYPPIS